MADSFNGSIDELRVFDRALSAEEAWQLFAADGGFQEPASGGGCSASDVGIGTGFPTALIVLAGLFYGLVRRRSRLR
jgi:MYXO-CTERM domain-containing protein